MEPEILDHIFYAHPSIKGVSISNTADPYKYTVRVKRRFADRVLGIMRPHTKTLVEYSVSEVLSRHVPLINFDIEVR